VEHNPAAGSALAGIIASTIYWELKSWIYL